MEELPKFFRFLDLPTEVRLLVYERIPLTNQHWAIDNANRLSLFWEVGREDEKDISLWLVVRQVSNAVLATCRSIHNEACAIIKHRRRHEVELETPRIILDMRLLAALTNWYGLVYKAAEWRNDLNEMKEMEEDLEEAEYKFSPMALSPEESRLATFIDLYGRRLHADPEIALEVSLFGPDSMLKPQTLYPSLVWVTNAYEFRLKLGIAGVQYLDNDLAKHRRWVKFLRREMRFFGGDYAEKVILNDQLSGRWIDIWGPEK